ncbi:MAG: lysylphosphatidylglycerol synthase transmembrane domain-containing protein [Planctomycetota bacterium]|nr:lysylphosphatidylglycerol synthase transmembrane domain-containing protein [Planctomycetota bacterium]
MSQAPLHLSLAKKLGGILVAALLVWAVARSVPWQDRLLVTWSEGAEEIEYVGTIRGPWKVAQVEYTLEKPESDAVTSEQPDWAVQVQKGATVLASATELSSGSSQFEFHQLEWRPGIPRVLGEMRLSAVIPAFLVLIACSLLVITRWYVLLIAVGCSTRWFQVLRVTYVGPFFNLVLPGMNGGDIARAYWIVKGHPDKRAVALMSVFVDRLLGLFAMTLLATVAIYTNNERFESLRLPVLAVCSAMLVGGLALINPHLRRLIRFDALMGKLPGGEKMKSLDSALRLYASRPMAVGLSILLSIANHLGAALALYMLGQGLGDHHGFHDYVCLATVVNTLSAVPITPGGLGVGEMLAGSMLRLAGGSYTIGVAASITYRVGLFALGLLGGLVLVMPGGAAIRRDLAEAEAAGETE